MGPVALTVTDLDRSLAYYQENIGLQVLARAGDAAMLGAGATPLLALEATAATRAVPSAAGLYHFALLVPSRLELARTLQHLVTTRTPIGGASDHHVSEALYLSDPDGHGIEIYRDRPRAEWVDAGGRFFMTTERLDVEGVMGELARDDRPWTGMDAGTVMGHVHLQVANVDAARRFYMDVLGFDHMIDYPSAGFLSAGGYHHHLGINMWNSAGRGQAPASAAHLRWFTVNVPAAEELQAVAARAAAHGIETTAQGDTLQLRDPSGNALHVHVQA